MSEITIKQARTEDIHMIENILLDTVSWLNEMEQPLWGAGEVSWDALSKKYENWNGMPTFHRAITRRAKQSGFRCRLS